MIYSTVSSRSRRCHCIRKSCIRILFSAKNIQIFYTYELISSLPRFDVTPSICLAINNIDYVLEFIKPFVTEELGTEETLDKLERTSGRVVAASCRYGTLIS